MFETIKKSIKIIEKYIFNDWNDCREPLSKSCREYFFIAYTIVEKSVTL